MLRRPTIDAILEIFIKEFGVVFSYPEGIDPLYKSLFLPNSVYGNVYYITAQPPNSFLKLVTAYLMGEHQSSYVSCLLISDHSPWFVRIFEHRSETPPLPFSAEYLQKFHETELVLVE